MYVAVGLIEYLLTIEIDESLDKKYTIQSTYTSQKKSQAPTSSLINPHGDANMKLSAPYNVRDDRHQIGAMNWAALALVLSLPPGLLAQDGDGAGAGSQSRAMSEAKNYDFGGDSRSEAMSQAENYGADLGSRSGAMSLVQNYGAGGGSQSAAMSQAESDVKGVSALSHSLAEAESYGAGAGSQSRAMSEAKNCLVLLITPQLLVPLFLTCENPYGSSPHKNKVVYSRQTNQNHIVFHYRVPLAGDPGVPHKAKSFKSPTDSDAC
ncbi:unnamed protein product [Arctia plantaginis]|uniref:Uncharacterized protein n=1 Tax=Arctia plantaginis TaxID=874455 RepID=A0A8S1AJL8_ARCPL|nr:unnamed protein product [Arctia plantaginis]